MTFLRIPLILLTITCSLLLNHQSFCQEPANKEEAEPAEPAEREPIAFNGFTQYAQIKKMQQEYIDVEYEGCRVLSVTYSLPKDTNGAYIETFALENKEGERVEVPFDLTEAYHKRQQNGNEELKKLVEGMEEHRRKRPIKLLSLMDILQIQNAQKKLEENMKEQISKTGKSFEELTKDEQQQLVEEYEKAMDELINDRLERKQNESSSLNHEQP